MCVFIVVEDDPKGPLVSRVGTLGICLTPPMNDTDKEVPHESLESRKSAADLHFICRLPVTEK